MANPALVQQNTIVTTTSGPATIAAALGSNSTAGNLLLMWVQVSSSAANAAITTPANWILIASQANAAGTAVIALFALPNNAGGIGGVTVTITSTTGSAEVTMLEFSGMGTNPPTEQITGTTGTSNAINIPAFRQFTPVKTAGALWLWCIGCVAGNTFTQLDSQGFSTPQNASASGATANGQIINAFLITLGPAPLQNGLTLTNLAVFEMLVVKFSGNLGPVYGGGPGTGPGGTVEGVSGSPNPQGSWSVG